MVHRDRNFDLPAHWVMLSAGLPGMIVGMVQSYRIVASSPVLPTVAQLIAPVLQALFVTALLLPPAIGSGWFLFRPRR